jgi:uncharacterized SAM-binding protein YcdF (DUF218 family)
VFFFLSKLLTIFLLPLTWITLLFGVSLVVKDTKLKGLFRIYGITLFFLFGNSPLISSIMDAWEGPLDPNQAKATAQVAIVLGGGQINDYASTGKHIYFDFAADRLLQALQLYKHGQVAKILVSSGSLYPDRPTYSEADFCAKFLMQEGVPSEHILIERYAKNTYENAVFSHQILKENGLEHATCLLITSAFHMRRSVACFSKQGINFKRYACNWQDTSGQWTHILDYLPQYKSFELWSILLKEWFGMATYKLMNYS